MRATVLALLAFAALVLSGCASAPGPTPGSTPTSPPDRQAMPDGKDVHSIACTGANWADCYEKAGKACANRGYVILRHGDSAASASAGAGASGGRSGGGSRTMVIQCKDWSPR